MTTWQSQYIPEGDPMDREGWYVRTEWDTADEVRMVLGVHSEEEAVRVAEYLNAAETDAHEWREYTAPAIWDLPHKYRNNGGDPYDDPNGWPCRTCGKRQDDDLHEL